MPDFMNRYGLDVVPKTTAELESLIAAGITEATRVLVPKVACSSSVWTT
jgi:hypothetical protein